MPVQLAGIAMIGDSKCDPVRSYRRDHVTTCSLRLRRNRKCRHGFDPGKDLDNA